MPQSTFILQLPKAWPAKIRSAMLQVVSLAKFSAKKSSPTAQFPLRKTRGTSIPKAKFTLEVERLDRQMHLPIVRLHRAA